MWLLSTIEQFFPNYGVLNSIVCQEHHLKVRILFHARILNINRMLLRYGPCLNSRAHDRCAGVDAEYRGVTRAVFLTFRQPWTTSWAVSAFADHIRKFPTAKFHASE
jgi:hypothetical protein